MFKCKECGCEYEVKPDYCDCGNDEFVEVTPVAAKGVNGGVSKGVNKEVNEGAKVEVNAEVNVKEVVTSAVMPKVDILSLVIFITCIICSFLVIFFLFNPKEIEVNEKGNTVVAQTAKIPPIDSFWKDPVPVKVEAPKAEEPKPVVKPAPVAVKKPVTKTVTKPKTTQQSKPVQTKPAQKTKAEIALEEAQKAEAAKRAAEKKKADDDAKKLAEVKKAAEDMQKAMAAKQELAEYKTRLRNTIGKRIDFTRVVGDGDCAISFKIDSNGKLVNGAFSKQSSNITLNDAVYKAFMLTRSYNSPPSAYKGETWTLNVSFYNGNFEISLK